MTSPTIHPVALRPARERNTEAYAALLRAEPSLITLDPKVVILALAALRRRLKVVSKITSGVQV